MLYRQVLAVGWAIAWKALWWSLVIILPPGILAALLVHRYSLSAGTEDAISLLISAVLGVFAVFPLSIREAIGSSYSGFRVAVVGRERLSYVELLQISLMAILIHGGVECTLYWLQVRQWIGAWIFYPLDLLLLVLVVYPAIAAAALSMQFFGFRLAIVPHKVT